MRKILALDQASRVSGWSYFEDDKLVAYGKFSADSDDIGERLNYIKKQVISLINKYDITEVAFEDIQLQNNVVNNVQTFKILAEVFGVIYELVTDLKLPHSIVLAGTWKSALGIKGAGRPEQKKNAQLYVMKTYDIKPTQDECDAICIGTYVATKKKSAQAEAGFDWSD